MSISNVATVQNSCIATKGFISLTNLTCVLNGMTISITDGFTTANHSTQTEFEFTINGLTNPRSLT
jgi:hypothetical protein